MGKAARPRALADNQARAVGRNIRVSPRKLNLVAQQIRGRSAESALATLKFSPKRIALDVKKVLQSAIANAENNHDLDVDDLVVSEASVGRNLVMKRFHARARGRGARIEKPFSQLTIVVEEKREEKAAKPHNRSPEARAAAAERGDKKPAKKKAAKKPTKAGAAKTGKSKETA
jgi:large subunit ribosomal protein L22